MKALINGSETLLELIKSILLDKNNYGSDFIFSRRPASETRFCRKMLKSRMSGTQGNLVQNSGRTQGIFCEKCVGTLQWSTFDIGIWKSLFDVLIIKALPPTPPKRLIKLAFVKAGKSVSKSKVTPTSILHLASDWVIVSDLQNSYIFPGHIALTSLRPDIVIFSNSLKRVILIELTCPCEENMESWHSIKLTKYSALV